LEKVILLSGGRSDYYKMWDLQKHLHSQVTQNGRKHYLIITEHEPVITIGKSGNAQNLLVTQEYLKQHDITLVENDRGGDITFHGPGQLVGYPILNLAYFKKDINWYLRSLEEVVIATLKEFRLDANRVQGITGVWINNKKVCAIGVKTSRWVTMHGFALNVQTNLDYFNLIIPCGINDKGVTSISHELGNTIEINDVINILKSQFENIFKVAVIQGDVSSINN
jgi:lipoyl(octanoyl) transferase